MQHYEPASIQTLRHQNDTPTFKTNVLRLDSNKAVVHATAATVLAVPLFY